MKRFLERIQYAPVAAALLLLIIAGFTLIHKEDKQARDTIRKHHLADIETALGLAKRQHGQFPPYDQLTWCGVISDPTNSSVQAAIEVPLRQAVEKYENPQKPFPEDPNNPVKNYYYWKRSPSMFELYSVLEAAPTGDRNTFSCPTGLHTAYDYGISSILREGANGSTIENSPL
ncbi:MAG: hypothetical protein A3E36_03520 [Candidatus Andersenbacteria bacterium RIFCSPHIGHO2_12_FULL_45_11b]|uniref:Type II secretion system protein GspG C-terminal domain-containing protein n=1 Tax=Candidatus Andersenbacteria bacterium RIFCSPHIGHO2_12_FULL_45_11b TaxID=1797282 RepID=A0A1G1XAU0_9BACT|nr:MAG: hypothetical protein A3E36_03520 [Candidatus Andersenbacteria bacterium RIFCSPHIGHO2_12_FULL_45_11b]